MKFITMCIHTAFLLCISSYGNTMEKGTINNNKNIIHEQKQNINNSITDNKNTVVKFKDKDDEQKGLLSSLIHCCSVMNHSENKEYKQLFTEYNKIACAQKNGGKEITTQEFLGLLKIDIQNEINKYLNENNIKNMSEYDGTYATLYLYVLENILDYDNNKSDNSIDSISDKYSYSLVNLSPFNKLPKAIQAAIIHDRYEGGNLRNFKDITRLICSINNTNTLDKYYAEIRKYNNIELNVENNVFSLGAILLLKTENNLQDNNKVCVNKSDTDSYYLAAQKMDNGKWKLIDSVKGTEHIYETLTEIIFPEEPYGYKLVPALLFFNKLGQDKCDKYNLNEYLFECLFNYSFDFLSEKIFSRKNMYILYKISQAMMYYAFHDNKNAILSLRLIWKDLKMRVKNLDPHRLYKLNSFSDITNLNEQEKRKILLKEKNKIINIYNEIFLTKSCDIPDISKKLYALLRALLYDMGAISVNDINPFYIIQKCIVEYAKKHNDLYYEYQNLRKSEIKKEIEITKTINNNKHVKQHIYKIIENARKQKKINNQEELRLFLEFLLPSINDKQLIDMFNENNEFEDFFSFFYEKSEYRFLVEDEYYYKILSDIFTIMTKENQTPFE